MLSIIFADKESIVDCRDKNFGTNDVLYYDLTTLDNHQLFSKLILSKNNIVLLPVQVLRNLKFVKVLDLSQNHLDSVHPDIFNNLNSLEDLDYSSNLLYSFDISILNAASSLTKLNLSLNEISNLKKSLPCTEIKLRVLDLSHNNLVHLPKDMLNPLEQLEYLDLSFNKLTNLEISGSEKGSQSTEIKLKVLNLSHNNLVHLPKDILNSLGQLEYLDLSFNKLTNLQTNSLVQLHLKVFRINDNHLQFLNLQDFPLSLTELYAGNNFINILSPKKLFLHVLNLENNQISNLWENLTLLEEIRHLNLSGNGLTDFPEIVMKKVELLDLSLNNLSIIPESISTKNFPMLKKLYVNGNHLKDARIRSELRLNVFEASFVGDIEEINEEMFQKLRERENECINMTISNNMKLRVLQENVFRHMNVCSVSKYFLNSFLIFSYLLF